MTTANDVIRRAYRLTNEVGRTEEPSAEQYDDGLAALNEMLDQWRSDDIDLGLYDVASSTEIPREYVRHLRYNLAMELAMESGLDIHPTLAQRADELKAELENPWIPEMYIDETLLRNHRRYNIDGDGFR